MLFESSTDETFQYALKWRLKDLGAESSFILFYIKSKVITPYEVIGVTGKLLKDLRDRGYYL